MDTSLERVEGLGLSVKGIGFMGACLLRRRKKKACLTRKPCTLHPKTLYPQPCTLNPTPSTVQPDPYTPNPEPCNLNFTPYTHGQDECGGWGEGCTARGFSVRCCGCKVQPRKSVRLTWENKSVYTQFVPTFRNFDFYLGRMLTYEHFKRVRSDYSSGGPLCPTILPGKGRAV